MKGKKQINLKKSERETPKRGELKKARIRFELRKQNSSTSLLAAGVAHEFNNILGAVDGHAEWALDSGKLGDCVEALKSIREACHRSVQITRSLQNFAQPLEETEQKVILYKLVDQLQKEFFLRFEAARIQFESSVDKKIVLVANPRRVEEVFRNLIKNAIEAFDQNQSSSTLNREKKIWIRSTEKSLIEIGDNGPGIPEVFQAFLFQPFFTTKGVLKHLAPSEAPLGEGFKGGMGLGLYRAKIAAAESGLELSLGISNPFGTKWILKFLKRK